MFQRPRPCHGRETHLALGGIALQLPHEGCHVTASEVARGVGRQQQNRRFFGGFGQPAKAPKDGRWMEDGWNAWDFGPSLEASDLVVAQDGKFEIYCRFLCAERRQCYFRVSTQQNRNFVWDIFGRFSQTTEIGIGKKAWHTKFGTQFSGILPSTKMETPIHM